MSQSQTSLVQIINGVREVKINNSQRKNRWKWEQVQISLFKTSMSGLKLAQYQSIGSNFINELKNIIITFLDRKSTRLNSSHVRISYAVFCLKKKKYILLHLV